ncbi:MAG: glycosyltransferase family 2 protein [Kiritimatiellia bacterium]
MTPSSSAPLHRITPPELIVVMPVYNEAEVVESVVHEWLKMLDGLNVSYRLQVCDDGSTDQTAGVLDHLSHPSLEIHHARNRGHGPTVLRAFKVAASRSPWIFQTDSDGEIPASAFPEFWQARKQADFVVGFRENRISPPDRQIITSVLRGIMWLLFGRRLRDGNCPYRLMRSETFRPLFDQLPEDSFAPNVLISGFSVLDRLRILELSVPHHPRQTGVCSIRKLKLLRAALLSARQTLSFRMRYKRKSKYAGTQSKS